MKIMERYIAITAVGLIALTLLLVLGVDFLFGYVHELGGIGRGDYNAFAAFTYTALTLPRRLYNLFPMASLIGVLLALGLLSSRSELIVMRASGFSVLQIAKAIAKVGLVLAILVTLLGELVVPEAEYAAEAMKIRAKSAGQAVLTAQGTWIKEGREFIHVQSLLPKQILQGVSVYEFNDAYELQQSTFIEQAKYRQKAWQLSDVSTSTITREAVKTTHADQTTRDKLVDPKILDVLLSEPDDLSLLGLTRYIHYLKSNNLDANYYQLLFWKKILQPLAVIVMVLLGIPFVFGPLRSSSMGLRMVTGIIVGFMFYLANEIFGPLSLVYHLPPLAAAVIPLLLMGGLGFYFMRRVL